MARRERRDNTDKVLFERKKISLIRPEDSLTALLFLVSLIASIIAGAVCLKVFDMAVLEMSVMITIPLVVLGVFHIIRSRWWYLLIVIGISVAMILSHVDYVWIVALALISVGIVGVVELVALIQRAIFYRVVSSVEFLNVKTDLTPWDRIVAFVFNISGDLDTRNLQINENINRASTPWGEVWSSLKISFQIGIFIWIYISMNPSWMQFESLSSVPVYMFCVMMYIPVLVLPFSVFMSLNVRIETKYRDFRIYDGIKGTLLRMAVPIFAAFMYILLAVNDNGYEDVLAFIFLSLVFNFLISMAACVVYYRGFEARILTDIVSKWNEFRPVRILMGIDSTEGGEKENVPDTPRRDYSQMGELVFPEDLR